MMNVVCVIQARMRSTRLPGKVLLPLVDMTVLETIVRRIMCAKTVNKIVVATSTSGADAAIQRLCAEKDIPCFRGSEEDVLDRVYQAAKHYKADIIVDITADCPLVDPRHIDRIIYEFLGQSYSRKDDCKVDYASNCLLREWPDGLDIQAYTMDALEKVWRNSASVREHVGWNIGQAAMNGADYECRHISPPTKYTLPHWGLTLDEKEDYDLLLCLFREAYIANGNIQFPVEWVLNYLLNNLHLLDINKNIKRKVPGNG
jgi:spore coat polysaccharide biosynthesis protein SpsF (cytidylyltransferase family)